MTSSKIALLIGSFLFFVVVVSFAVSRSGGDNELESAWRRAMDAGMNRDYEQLWDLLATKSKAKLGEQLNRLRAQLDAGGSQALAAKETLRQLGIEPARIFHLNTKEYFLEMFRCLDLAQPGTRANQIKEQANASITRIDRNGSHATVHWLTTSGRTMSETLVRENGEWKALGTVH